MAEARYTYKPHPQEERIKYVKKVSKGDVSYGYTDYSRHYNPFPPSGVLVAEDKHDHHRVIISREEAKKVFKEE